MMKPEKRLHIAKKALDNMAATCALGVMAMVIIPYKV